MRFRTLLIGHDGAHRKDRISDTLDRMTPESRLYTAMSMAGAEFKELWDLCQGSEVSADHFVPGSEPLVPVIHQGKNSLPTFSRFEKRFCRSSADPNLIIGYNHQTFRLFTGPGYFVGAAMEATHAPSSFVLDYSQLPTAVPKGWPKPVPNSARLGRFVFDKSRDYMRRVSEHVSLGRLYKNDQPEDVFFILCRTDDVQA